ncbi:Hypothetical predicted protein, partial [Podarcis lilfordi]
NHNGLLFDTKQRRQSSPSGLLGYKTSHKQMKNYSGSSRSSWLKRIFTPGKCLKL